MTDFNPKKPSHMAESLNISNFATRAFNITGFRSLLDSISDMRCLTTLILSNNGIDDIYLPDLELLLKQTKIRRLDLSLNCLTKAGGLAIAKILKE